MALEAEISVYPAPGAFVPISFESLSAAPAGACERVWEESFLPFRSGSG